MLVLAEVYISEVLIFVVFGYLFRRTSIVDDIIELVDNILVQNRHIFIYE